MKKTLFIIVAVFAFLLGLCCVDLFTNRTGYNLKPDETNAFVIDTHNGKEETIKVAEFAIVNNELGISVEYVGNNHSVNDLKNIELKVFEKNGDGRTEMKTNSRYVMYKDIVPANLSGTKELGTLNSQKAFCELAKPLDIFKNDSTINFCFTVLNEYNTEPLPKNIELELCVNTKSGIKTFTCAYELETQKYSVVDLLRGTKLKDLKY